MGILNITPCKNVISSGGQIVQAPSLIETKAAINISADSTGTALPKLPGGNKEADFYMISVDSDMYFRLDESAAAASNVAIGNTYLPAGTVLFTGHISYQTHIAKLDK